MLSHAEPKTKAGLDPSIRRAAPEPCPFSEIQDLSAQPSINMTSLFWDGSSIQDTLRSGDLVYHLNWVVLEGYMISVDGLRHTPGDPI